uniref:Uncharacterized protein n=1 Tax=Oncorhynchus kisutch TaxID=8019 RepID=A0A8C7M1D7_ONCKI
YHTFIIISYFTGPRELGQGLESAAQHWLRPERRTAAEVVRCVALQRFVSLLPTHVGECVLKQCPQDMEEAIYMAEEYLNNTPGDKCSEMDNHTDGEGYPGQIIVFIGMHLLICCLFLFIFRPAEHQVNSEKMKVTGPGLFLKRIEFSKVCQSSTFNIDARHLEDIYSEERRLDGEDDLVEEDNFSEHEDWIKEEIKYNNQAEVEDEIRSASEMGQSTDVDRNTENVERSQFRNIANQMPVFGRAKRGVSAPVISSSSPNTAEKEGGTPCCLKRKDKEDPFHRPSHCCHDCGKSYKRAAFLSKHSCSAFPKFICPDCAQVFASQKCLTHHRRSHNKALGCPECGKQFRDKYNLKCHMRTHTGESPYTCTDCGDVFAQLKGLQEHRNIHTEERSFRCSVCGEGFHHSHTLTKHKLLHSQESFLCTRCGKSFKLNDDLLRHLRTVHDERQSGPVCLHSTF